MKKYLFPIVFLLIFLSAQAFGQTPQPRVLFAYNYFLMPGESPYIEFYLSVSGRSVAHIKMDDSLYHAKIEVTYAIKKENKIKAFEKFEIIGPGIENPDQFRQDFLDLKRFMLKKGEYTVDIVIKDLNQESTPVTGVEKLHVEMDKNMVGTSDIIWFRDIKPTSDTGSFVRNGYETTPYVFDVFPKTIDNLYYYAEMYNTQKVIGDTGAYVVHYYLKYLNADSIIQNREFYKRYKGSVVQPLMGNLDLTDLPMGDYIFGIEVLDRKKKMLGNKTSYFYRISDIPPVAKKKKILSPQADSLALVINSITNREMLQDYVKCIRPIADLHEERFIDNFWRNGENETLKSFFITFWISRDELLPLNAWKNYRKKVEQANNEYSTPVYKGYETDRGVVFLKYGAPSQITKRENEPSSYPYIIWQYYEHPVQTNAKYVFYNPDLVTNNYILLHSNVRGERQNYRWKYDLEKRNTPYGSIDKTKGEDHWGGRVDDYYNNPR